MTTNKQEMGIIDSSFPDELSYDIYDMGIMGFKIERKEILKRQTEVKMKIRLFKAITKEEEKKILDFKKNLDGKKYTRTT